MDSKMRNQVRNCDCNFLALRRSFHAVKASYRSSSPPVFRFLVYTSLHLAVDVACSKILRYVGEHRRALGNVHKYCGILLNTGCRLKCFNSIACAFLQAKDNLRRELVMYDSLRDRGGARGVPGGDQCPPKFCLAPPVAPPNFPRDVMPLHCNYLKL